MWTRLPAVVRGPMLIVLGGSLMAGGLSAESVEAAPNPLRESTRTHLVTVAADGSYHVTTTTTIDLALDARWDFGNTIHDGFRLPETESLLPPYLRADYSQVQASIDGTPAEATIEHNMHAVEITTEKRDLGPGTHESVLDYGVTGAAVPDTDSGDVVVYFRPLSGGDLVVRSEAPLIGLECETWPAQAQPCGSHETDDWHVDGQDVSVSVTRGVAAVRIRIDAEASELPEPVIDSDS